jgi:hypothetical protein
MSKTFSMAYGIILKTIITNIINVLLKILISAHLGLSALLPLFAFDSTPTFLMS